MSNEPALSKSERTKAAILDAAEDLFSELGYDGASLDAIGEQAGIRGTAILYHFPSKRELYEATLDRIFSPLVAELTTLLGTPRPDDAQLGDAVDSIVAYAAEHPNAPRLILRETTTGSTDARQIIEARAATNTAGIVGAFAARSDDDDVSQVMVANILVGAVCFYFVGPPGLAGSRPYDPHDPELVRAFSSTMRQLIRSRVHVDP